MAGDAGNTNNENMITKTLKAGTVVQIQGFPVELKTDVDAQSKNWELIDNAEKDAERVVPDADGGL